MPYALMKALTLPTIKFTFRRIFRILMIFFFNYLIDVKYALLA